MWKTIETLLVAEYKRVADTYPRVGVGKLWIDIYYKVESLLKEQGFTYIGEGRHRAVFRSPNGRYVVKVPICYEGVDANQYEAIRWKRRNAKRGGSPYPIAACRTICNGMLLVMQYVKQVSQKEADELPMWVDYVDCQQVGYLSNGKLVAYDYGS